MPETHLKPIVLIALVLLALSTLTACGTPEDFAKADNLRLDAQLHAEATRVAIGAEATRIAGQTQLELDRLRTQQDLKTQSDAAAETLKTQSEIAAQELKRQSDMAAQDLKAKTDLSVLEANQAATLSAVKVNEAKTLANIEADKANEIARTSTAWIGPVTIAVVVSLAALAVIVMSWGVSRAIVIRSYLKVRPNSVRRLSQPEDLKQLRQPDPDFRVELDDVGRHSWPASEDPAEEGTTLNNIGLIYHERGQLREAFDTYQQALSLFQEAGDRWSESTVLANIGMLLDTQGRPAEAATYLERCVTLMKEVGHPNLETNYSKLEVVRGKLRRSRRSLSSDINRR